MAQISREQFDAHKRRAQRAWAAKQPWSGVYQEVYDYVFPNRRVNNVAKGPRRGDRIMDHTGPDSAANGAAALKEDLFPTGSKWFRLTAGPLIKQAFKAEGTNSKSEKDFARKLEQIEDQVLPYFLTGAFDLAASDMCQDVFVGTGVMVVLEGDDRDPVRFVNIPFDDCTISVNGYNEVDGLYWTTKWSRRDIKAAFPKAKFAADFIGPKGENADQEDDLSQNFVLIDGKWHFVAFLPKDEQPLAVVTYQTQPFIAPRYSPSPGHALGNGPVIRALPTIKVLNKTQELTLKAAAIRMLGLWAYRPGGAFNPDVQRLGPGEFWPVQTTGGVMGPDVVRLDAASGDLNVSNLILSEMRAQVQRTLNDERLPDQGKTPISAAETMARTRMMRKTYINAFGRLTQEVIPLIPRVIEILHRKGLINAKIKIDHLLVGVEIVSPLALAIKSSEVEPMLQYVQTLAALGKDPEQFIDTDIAFADMGDALGVKQRWLKDAKARGAYAAQQQQKAMMAQLTEFIQSNPEMLQQMAAGGAAAPGGAPSPAAQSNVVPMRASA